MNRIHDNNGYNGITNANNYIFNVGSVKIENTDDSIEFCDDSSAEIEFYGFDSNNLPVVGVKKEIDDAVTDTDTAANAAIEEFYDEILPKIKSEQDEPNFSGFEIKTEPEFFTVIETMKTEMPTETNDVPEIPNVEENQSGQTMYSQIPKIKIKSSKLLKENVENVCEEKKASAKKSKIQKCENNLADFFKLLEDLAGSSDNINDVILSKTQEASRSESMEEITENDYNLSNTDSAAAQKIRWVIKRGPKRKNDDDRELLALQAELNQSTYLDKLLDSSLDQAADSLPEPQQPTKEYLTDTHSDSNSNSNSAAEQSFDKKRRKAEHRHKCTECPESFTIARLFEIHMEHVHHIKPYKCLYCPKEFARGKYLKYHTARHTGENLIKCTECDGQFARKIDYQRHKESHFGIVHKCPECDKAFTRLSNLNMHIKKHTGDKPFICEICDKVYYRAGGYRQHRELHEAREQDRFCKYCTLQFDTVDDFLKHCLNHAEIDKINQSK